jgi:ketosteroid isomerase-like protein
MAPTREARLSLAEGGMEAFNDGDLPRMLAALDEDVEVYASSDLVNAGSYRGHDGFVAWVTAWMEAWEKISVEVTENTPVGERHIVTAVHQEGRGRGGIEVDMDIAFLFEVNDEGLGTFLAMLPTADEAREMAEQREASG